MIRPPNTPVERLTPNSGEAQEDQRQLGLWREKLYQILSLGGSTTYAAGAIGATSFVTFTITVTGCYADKEQSVMVGPPAEINAGLLWNAVITANNVVTIRVYNTTAGPITPASSVWAVRVMP